MSNFIILLSAVLVAAGQPAIGQQAQTNVPAVDVKACAEELKCLRFGMFVCWSFSTFSNVEWSRGVKDISWFNPTGCDSDQWAQTAKDARMGYILFLTKHHDGFCLWDTKTTDRKVTNSPLGKDVLAAVRKSCDKFGLKLALYFSEGDWTWPGPYQQNGGGVNPEKKKAQLEELLTGYGPIEFIWFDYAVGDGGLSHPETVQWVHKFQPGCLVGFNAGPAAGEIRLGEMGKPSLLSELSGAGPNAQYMKGYEGYLLAEFTYPILGGRDRGRWFYTMPEWDNVCVPAEEIYRDYLGAVKLGNIFSLDVGPDRSGRLRDIDVKTLRKVGQYIRGEIRLPAELLS
jgi:alpha-L-fucosidase